LEEIVMAVKTRKDVFGLTTNIQTEELLATSRLVSTITGFPVQPNKAIVGANAFAHESGIHQDGVLKHRETYEIMRPEDVGWGKTKLALGKLSGRNAFKERLKTLGIALADEEKLNAAFARFKSLADKKQEIFDEDLYAIVNDEELEAGEKIRLIDLEIIARAGNHATARLTLSVHGEEKRLDCEGVGPVDAVFKGIETLCRSGATLALFSVNNITAGTDSQGEVTVRLQKDGRIVNGLGADMDIITASAKAYVNALNRLYFLNDKIHPQL
jgi:2-isopropylmalate synthase